MSGEKDMDTPLGTFFDNAISFVFEMEGSGSDDPNDPGGLTRWGISQKAHPEVDVASLTETQAKEIYWKEYWTACKCDQLPSPTLAFLVFDAAVNCGCGTAVRWLQTAVGATSDGVVGPQTIALVKSCDRLNAAEKITVLRLQRYHEIAGNSGTFFNGWARRAVACMGRAIQLC